MAVATEERKLATVLFADLVGSTAAASEQDPERTRARLARFYEAMAAEVERAGGTIEKFAGDAVMAVFGVPVAHEDDPERALHAALAMQRRLPELGDGLELRIGVNTGEVVAGEPQASSSFVSGDAVNVAARLEQAAGPGEILAGERTAAAVRGAFELGKPVRVEAKGKPEGLVARRVVRALSLMRPRGVSGLASSFVGRKADLERLCSAYRQAVEAGRSLAVTILGDAGVGKTRLVRELWERLGGESPEPLRRTGRCLSYGEATTYWPLGEILREHFGFAEDESPERISAVLGARHLLGLALGLDVAGDLHPLVARDRFQDAWVELVSELVADQPLVVLVEDVHWADDLLFEALEQLLENVLGPMLLIATARPELTDRRPALLARSAEVIELGPLSAQDSERMLDELLAGGLPDNVRDLVVERAEGNPFFVEELVGMLIDRNILRRTNGSWTLDDLPEDFAVPDSVQSVLAARIDLLEPPEKAALQAASVIGRVFWAGPVYELVESAPDLRLLEERDLVRRRPGSSLRDEREYAIKHALTREVAYASLPKAKRAHLHASFAEWIERAGLAGDEHAPLLAHHLAEAVRPDDIDLAWAGRDDELAALRARAVLWLCRAGDLAVRRYELHDAISLFQRALALESDRARRAEIWRSLGRTHALRFDGEAFLTSMQSSLEVCSSKSVCSDTYAELAFQTAIRSGMWKRRPDSELVEGWIESALEFAEPDSAARAKALIARAFWARLGTTHDAIEASRIAEGLGDLDLRSYAWAARAVAAFAEADYDASLTWAQRRLDVKDEISDPDHVCDIFEIAIPSCCAKGRFREARRLAAEHNMVVEPLSPHHRLHGIGVVLEVEEALGNWDSIADLKPRTEEIVAANLATPCIRNARSLLVTALALAHRGDAAAARKLEERANEVAGEGYDVVLSAPRTRLALLRGALDEVERLLAPLAEFRQRQTWFVLPTAAARLDALASVGDRERIEDEAAELARPNTYLEPFALRALGIVREDEELIEQALERFEAMHLDWHAAETRKLVAEA